MSNIKIKNGYVIVKGENVEYQSKHGLVVGNGGSLEKAGAGLKAEVLVGNDSFSVGDKIEFQRNFGVQIRKDIYAVKSENIFFVGDLDEILNQEKVEPLNKVKDEE